MKHIWEQLKKDENLAPGQEEEAVWLLWQQREEAQQQLKEWEFNLEGLKVNHGSIKEGLKVCKLMTGFK